MDIREQLLKEHSKANTQVIVNWIGTSPERLEQLIQLFTQDEYRVVQRAAWVLGDISIKFPYLLTPHYSLIIATMQTPLHPSVVRNSLRFFADIDPTLSEEEEGILVELCFNLLLDPQQPVAIQVHAMQCIANRLNTYPDLAIELKEIIEASYENGTAGFRSRGKKILKQIAKMGK
ncbi:MAG: hypothetical protein AAGJ93_01170 [Bacteroidota bacterium]